jgi:predicted O-methyltransferase YrrM
VSEFVIDKNGEFELDRIRFHIDLTPGKNRRPSDAHAFTIVKTRAFLDFYASLVKSRPHPDSILELGIFQGGSFVFLDKLFKPSRLAAIDLSAEPVESLVRYVSKLPNRYVHFGTSQDDRTALTRIIDTELSGKLDMVIDDASHLYEQTKRSFEILFPRLAPGGTYIIEDWAWSHTPPHQAQESPWRNKPALTNLVFELIALLGSTDKIAAIHINRPMLAITKSLSCAPISASSEIWSEIAIRGEAIPKI